MWIFNCRFFLKKADLVWALTDMFNGLMVIPNLIALLASVKIVKKLSKEHEFM